MKSKNASILTKLRRYQDTYCSPILFDFFSFRCSLYDCNLHLGLASIQETEKTKNLDKT